MFSLGQTIIVNDPVDVFTNGRKAVVTDVAAFGNVTVLTVRDERNWSFAIRAEKVVPA